ncbi:class I SAM-dependent methyltransferase [Acidisphaera sp. S103]|uniref:class I SAM-dependent methyltransferase n=1 Tax=Acidisphaera sp. S103 TaxID=1747223 RepID=UPI00131DDB58|nr:class I SAM-dependent methyltransferase [Acidisphaera sp. S103]
MNEQIGSSRLANPLSSREPLDFNPLNHPICARTPLRNTAFTAWAGHIPFAMCLVDILEPRVFAELGTHWGVSYCAFCQAVKELRLPTECFAVDTWQGDAHASFYTHEVFEDLSAYHDLHYSLFSKMLRSTFDDALSQFQDGSIDLLHIDGYHTYDAVKHDYETWLPKMSDRGVIIFHDTEVRDQESFGVWRFWDEIKQKYPSFSFYNCWGLGLIAVGKSVPDKLWPLVSASPDKADRIRRFFANLGGNLEKLYEISLQRENMQELIAAKTNECVRLEAALAAATASDPRLGRIRYRAVDKAIRLAGRVPFLLPVAKYAVMKAVPFYRSMRRHTSRV